VNQLPPLGTPQTQGRCLKPDRRNGTAAQDASGISGLPLPNSSGVMAFGPAAGVGRPLNMSLVQQ
jgi:hypothetical protein